MQRYILSRMLQSLVALFVVIVLVFALTRLTGNPLDYILPPDANEQQRRYASSELGLDQPIYVQFVRYFRGVVTGDLGTSIRTKQPVTALIGDRFGATFQLGLVSMLMSLLIALPIGVYSAVRFGSWLDAAGRAFAVLGQSMPSFWLGILLIMVFSVWIPLFPTGGMEGIQSFILPAVTLGWYIAAGMMRITRSSMLDVMGSEFVKLARAKGMPERTVIWKHGLKNALIPILTFTALLFVWLLTGTVAVEMVFAWPGMGRLALDAIQWRDFPVAQGVVLLLSSAYILANLAVDILYGYVNPKIRYQK